MLINAVTPGPVAGELWLGPGGLAEQTAQAQSKTKEQVLEADEVLHSYRSASLDAPPAAGM